MESRSNTKFLIHENASQDVFCKMEGILLHPQSVKPSKNYSKEKQYKTKHNTPLCILYVMYCAGDEASIFIQAWCVIGSIQRYHCYRRSGPVNTEVTLRHVNIWCNFVTHWSARRTAGPAITPRLAREPVSGAGITHSF